MMSDNAQKYFARYNENMSLATKMEEQLPDQRGWSCVVRFYAALHLLNAYLVDKGTLQFNPKSTEHKERKGALANCPELRDAPHKYRLLKDISEAVRYDITFPYTEETDKYVKSLLKKIIAIVEPKLTKE